MVFRIHLCPWARERIDVKGRLYCLVNLQSSVAFLTNVNGESGLKGMDKEEFDTKFAIAEKAVETGNYDEVEKWNVGLDDSLLDDD